MSPSPVVDRRHLDFVLYDMLDAESVLRYPRFASHSRETFDAVIELAHRLAVDKFLSHNRKSDLNEPRMVDGKVELIPEIGEAVAAFNEAGFAAALADEARGGMQLPFLVTSACDALFSGANPSTVAYPLLARAAANLLEAHADASQKDRYMQPILAGRWFGTMCLSEPQAGSSLADIRTSAHPQADGSYRLEGAKMWISAGDHELGENIVHLVLARTTGAPAGVRGISLFIVPRFKVNADGSRGARNDVRLAGVNHKMGQRGSVNTFLKFGEAGDCVAELVGEPNQGLAYMFHMMNEERIGVGMGAVMQGYAGYLNSLGYARERRQGRHPDQKDPASLPIPIIEHADVRRMLLKQRSYVEGSHALGLYAAMLVDVSLQDPDADTRHEAELLLELLTPIVKAWSSDRCLEANEIAVQVLGGYGYTREFPVEQCYRDNRINPIHEGTNGIQALDLLGRKAMMENGAPLALLFDRIARTIDDASRDPTLAAMAEELRAMLARAEAATRAVAERMRRGEVRRGLANAAHYMTLLGHVAIAWMWLWQALAAARRGDDAFTRGKIATCHYFFAVELPEAMLAAKLVAEADDSAFAFSAEWF